MSTYEFRSSSFVKSYAARDIEDAITQFLNEKFPEKTFNSFSDSLEVLCECFDGKILQDGEVLYECVDDISISK